MELTDNIMYNALLEKDPNFEGLFFAAIKTTGIFCRPTCTAKKPKKENVEYFTTIYAALAKGYRPCKICKPQYLPQQMPEYITHLLAAIEDRPDIKIKDSDLMIQGLNPNTVRRWFTQHFNMTFHAYQRMFRLNLAFNKIQQGETVLDIAYNSGFESLSGFNGSFKNIFGVTPSRAKKQNTITLNRIETPLGTMFAAATENGICLLEFTDRKMLETELKYISKHFNAVILPGKNNHLDILNKQLNEYFTKQRKSFDIPLVLAGTEFQQHVWKILQQIPYGQTRSYQQQAEHLGKPSAIRAVANANGMNRISIIIPCHRVIGADGHLTGYGGGLWRKNWLLELEKNNQ